MIRTPWLDTAPGLDGIRSADSRVSERYATGPGRPDPPGGRAGIAGAWERSSEHGGQPLLHAGDVHGRPGPGDLGVVRGEGVQDGPVLGERALPGARLGQATPDPGPERRPGQRLQQ